MRQRDALNYVWRDPKSLDFVRVGDKWGLIVRFIFTHYGVAGGLGFFSSSVALIVLAFLWVQINRIRVGETSNEAWKRKWLRDNAASIDAPNMKALRPYNRGWLRNFEEVLFPGCVLNQSGFFSLSSRSKSKTM
jgi:hypothetical protein